MPFVVKCRYSHGVVSEVTKRAEDKPDARKLMTLFASANIKTYKSDTLNRFSDVRLLQSFGGLGTNPDNPEIYIRCENKTLEYWYAEEEKLQQEEAKPGAKEKTRRKAKSTTSNG